MDLHSIEICAGVGMLGEGVRAAFGLLGIKHRTVCYVEREAPAAAQIARLMEAGALDSAPIWSDLLTFDGTAWRGCVDFIIAGFPCQDISIAGRRAGLDGKRSGLFFDILDIADACQARGLVLENVAALATATASAVDEAEGTLEERAAARVVGELADRGWDAEWLTISASDVGASHGRARWFCLAWRRVGDAKCSRRQQARRRSGEHTGRQLEPGCGAMDDAERVELAGQRIHTRPRPEGHGAPDLDGEGPAMSDATGDGRHEGWAESGGQQGRPDAAQRGGAVAYAGQPGLPYPEQPEQPGNAQPLGRRAVAELHRTPFFAPGPVDPRWPEIVANRPDIAPAVESGVRMLANGMAYLVDESRTHQLRQIGNGVVPLQAAAALVELMRRAEGRGNTA